MAPPQSRSQVAAHSQLNTTGDAKRKRHSMPTELPPSKELTPSPAKRQAIQVSSPARSVQNSPQLQHKTTRQKENFRPSNHEQEKSSNNTLDPVQHQKETLSLQPHPHDATGQVPERAATPADRVQEMVDPLFLEMPFLPSSPEPEDDSTGSRDDASDIDTWIDAQVARGKADESTVIAALRCTSMDPELAETVLERWDTKNGMPEDMPGVWTAEDDQCLEGEDARDIERVLKKHGKDSVNSRWEYLRMAREAGLIH